MIGKRGRLAKRLALLFILIAILPLLAGGILSVYSGFQFVNQEIATRQKSILSLGNTYISSYVDNVFGNLKLTGEITSTNQKNYDRALEAICINSPGLYHELAVTDTQGKELSHLIDCIPSSPKKLTNRSDSESFFRAKQGQMFIGNVSFVADRHLVTISRTVKGEKNDNYVVIAVVKFDKLWQGLTLLEPGVGSYFYIVDRRGNLIGYKDLKVVKQSINLASFPTVNPLINKRQGAIAQRYVGLFGTEVIGTSTLLKNTNWGIVVEQPVAQALAAPNRLIYNFTWLIVAVSSVAIAGAFMLAQYIVRPINLLAQGAEAIAQGDLSYQIEIADKNEIGILARTFNQMTRQLKISRETLEEYNHTLSQKVEHRTQELIKSQQRLSLLFQQTPLAVIEWNINFEVIEWNPAAQAIFGYSKNEAMGRHGVGLIVPESARDNVNQVWNETSTRKSVTRSTNENLTKDGRIIICEWYNTPLIDSDGNAIGIASMALDITTRKQAETDLARFAAILEATTDFVGIYNLHTEFIYLNKAGRRMLGMSADEDISFLKIPNCHPEWAYKIISEEGIPYAMLNGVWSGETALITRDVREISVSQVILVMRRDSGEIDYFATMIRDISDRKQVEEALRTSKEYLRLIIDNIPQQVFWKDTNLVFQGCNKNWAESAQLESPEAVVGKTDYDLVANREVAELFRTQDRRIMETNKPELHIIAAKQKPSQDGETIWLDICKIPMQDSTGKVIGLVGVLEDITDRKQTEAILQRQAAVIEAALDGIAILNSSGEFIYTNKAYAQIYSYETQAELIGKTWKFLYSQDDVKIAEQRYEQEIMPALLKERQWRGEETIIIRNGSTTSLEILHYLLESGEQVCIVRDITDRKQAESALREREEQYHSIFEASNDGLIINNFDGFVVEANTATCRMYGHDYEDFIGLHATEFIHPDERQRAAEDLQNIFQNGGHFKTQGIHLRKDGTAFPIEVNAINFIYKGQPHMMSVIRDITERKQAEEALRAETEKSERLLLNILPSAIANRLKQDQGYIADSFPEVTVLFADIVGFTELSTRLSPTELVAILNEIFSEFDRLAEKHGLEKIKTIGDAYMVVGGLPTPSPNHAEAIAEMALDMQTEIAQFNTSTSQSFSIRIGINSGPVVAGVIGIKKFIYDLWGDTVNTASRMESHGIPGRIQVTASTYNLLREKFLFEERGAISIKGKGEMITYLLTGRKKLGN